MPSLSLSILYERDPGSTSISNAATVYNVQAVMLTDRGFQTAIMLSPSSILAPDHGAVPSHLHFKIGQDRSGRWIVQEMHGLGGGLFNSREAALHYARSQNRKQADAVAFSDEPVEWSIA